MADKAVEQPEVAVEVVDKCEKKPAEEVKATDKAVETKEKGKEDKKDDAPAADKDAAAAAATENGDAESGDKKDAKNGDTVASTDDEKLCSINKRKSTGGGDAPEGTPAEETAPEKKAKIADTDEKKKDADKKAAKEAENGDKAAQITA